MPRLSTWGVELSHRGGNCGFEAMLAHFSLLDPVLSDVARIVHEADLADACFDAPKTPGFEVVCRGLSMVREDKAVLSVTGSLFDGLYGYRRRALLHGKEPW